MTAAVIVPLVVAGVSLLGALVAGAVSVYATIRAERANASHARLQNRLDLGLAKMMQVAKEEIDVLLEAGALIAEAQRKAMMLRGGIRPVLDDMPERRFEEFLAAQTWLSASRRDALRESSDKTRLYARYLSLHELDEAWRAVYVVRDFVEAKVALLDERVLLSLRDHIRLMIDILSDVEEDRAERVEDCAFRKELRENWKKLEPSYRELVRLLRAALHDQPRTPGP